MAERVLITGGSGMIGSHLTGLLVEQGYDVGVLSRQNNPPLPVKSWKWDIDKGEIDDKSIEFADHIIHLAGANIGDKKWSAARKREIRDSRIMSTELLYRKLRENGKSLKSFISASGISFYGWNTGSILVDENRNKPGDDFLAVVVKEWEASVNRIGELGIRTVILRNGPVLSTKGGFLKKTIPVVNFWLGAGLGNGEQYISWIHVHDLCRLILFAIKNEELRGVFNAVAPEPVTNKEMMEAVARSLHKPFFLPNVPPFVIRLMYGEMASTVLGGNRISSALIESKGFEFDFRNVNEALNDLIKT